MNKTVKNFAKTFGYIAGVGTLIHQSFLLYQISQKGEVTLYEDNPFILYSEMAAAVAGTVILGGMMVNYFREQKEEKK